MAAAAFPDRSPSAPASINQSHHNSQDSAHAQQHPEGACSFRELSAGHSCGCRRFSVSDTTHSQEKQTSDGVGSLPGRAWCFCGHHACFHEWDRQPVPSSSPVTGERQPIWSDYNTRAATVEHVPRQLSFAMRQTPPVSLATSIGMVTQSSHYHQRPSAELPRAILPYPDSENLPSTQSSFKLPSDVSSHSSGRDRLNLNRNSPINFPGLQMCPPFLHTSSCITGQTDETVRSTTELVGPNNTSNVQNQLLEEADIAFTAARTSLEKLSKTLGGSGNHSSQLGDSEFKNGTNTNIEAHASDSIVVELMARIASLRAILLSVPNFRTSFSGLSQRVDALENLSMCHGSSDDFQERYEHFDGRMLDVEGKVEELERLSESVVARFSRSPHLEGLIDAFKDGSSSGGSSNSGVGAIDYGEILSRLDNIDRRLSNFEAAALPSDNNLWSIEVVLIPWGRQLKGLWWSCASDFSQVSVNNVDCQTPPDWRQSSEKEWMLPRACGPTRGTFGRVYERLKSRGLIRTVEISSNSARGIEFEIMWNFASLLRALDEGERNFTNSRRTTGQLLGLRNPFIPLRKVHRSSQLRFLDAAELTTPSLWTADFLNTNVLMKAPVAGKKCLFITTSSAYFQTDEDDGWTWQNLRELPRLDPESKDSQAQSDFVGEADAMEPCWNSDPRLDPPPSVHSSFASSGTSKSLFGSSFASPPPSPRQLVGNESPAPSANSHDTELIEQVGDDFASRGPVERHAPVTPMSEYLAPGVHFQPIQRRPSFPLNTTEATSMSVPANNKRQLPQSEETSSTVQTLPWKRPCLSKSPSGDGIRDTDLAFTPRRSREPPSPGWLQQYQRPGLHSRNGFDNEIDPVLFEGVRKRGVTPSAYATPYSNTLVEHVEGGTDVDVHDDEEDDEEQSVEDVDLASEGAHAMAEDEDVWEGLIEEEEDEDELGR